MQPVLRQGAAIFPGWRQVRAVPEKRHSRVDEVECFPIWIFGIFLYDVFPYAVEHLAGIFRRKRSWHCRHAALDI